MRKARYILGMAWQSIVANLARSLLMMLGVTIGVAASSPWWRRATGRAPK